MEIEEVKANIAQNVIGKVKAVHTMDKHRYQLWDGSIVDSVTQRNILEKPHLVVWSIKLALEFFEQDDRWQQLKGPTRDALLTTAKFLWRDTRDDAGQVGGKAHDMLEMWVKDWIASGNNPGDIREYLKAKGHEDFRVWGSARAGAAAINKLEVIPVASELLVGWEKEGAGTLDLLAMNNKGELELLDFKTSNQVDDFYALQVSAYRRFFQKMTNLKISHVRILKLDKESDRFHVYNIPYPNRAYAAFRALSKVYDFRESPMKKLVEEKNRVTL